MLKKKILNVLLLLAFLLGYMQWGKGNHLFIFQAVGELVTKGKENISNIIHPLIVIPLAGVLLLLITLFQKEPSRKLTLAAMASLGILMLLLLFIGIISLNYLMILCAAPFFIISYLVIKQSH